MAYSEDGALSDKIAQVDTLAFLGIEPTLVSVELYSSSKGRPAFNLVGLPDKTISEAKERINASLESVGVNLLSKRITVNLYPADLPKEGSHYDLPIALAILACEGMLDSQALKNYVSIGEIGLDASIRRSRGVVAAALYASKNNRALICPEANGGEAACIKDLDIIAAKNLAELVNCLSGKISLEKPKSISFTSSGAKKNSVRDLSHIKGQELAKRALKIACAGRHNLIMVGPPGVGKSILASTVLGILPPLSEQEAIEVCAIQNLAGESADTIKLERPYYAPHSSSSAVAIVGGGTPIRPGAISLAHKGVLFLDELPEFRRDVLDALRQPMETGKIHVARSQKHIVLPAEFQLIAAMNSCKCGDASKCAKGDKCARDYQLRIPMPIWDRIDIRVDLKPLKTMAQEIIAQSGGDSYAQSDDGASESAVFKKDLEACMAFQKERMKSLGLEYIYNSRLDFDLLENYLCKLDQKSKTIIESCLKQDKLTARGYHRVLRVARTIADLEQSDKVTYEHMAEALSYRNS